MQLFKNLITYLLVLVISAGVFFYIVKDKQVKNDILKTTLELFGDDLLAMYPEGEQKELLASKFNDFLRRAEEEKVAPQEIERVAAGILNITSMDTLPPAESVIGILEPRPAVPVMVQADTLTPSETRFVDRFKDREKSRRDKREKVNKYDYHWDRESKEDLAQRLKEVKDLQSEMKTLWKNDSTLHPLQKRVFFHADSGLRVEIDVDLESLIQEHKVLQEQLKGLEKENVIVWQQNLDPARVGLRTARMVMKNLPIEVPDIDALVQTGVLPDSIQFSSEFNFDFDSLGTFIEETVKEIEKLEAEQSTGTAVTPE